VLQEMAENVFVETGRPKMYEMPSSWSASRRDAEPGPEGRLPNVDSIRHCLPTLGVPRDLFTRCSPSRAWPLAVALAGAGEEQPHLPPNSLRRKHDVHYVPLEKRPEDENSPPRRQGPKKH